MTLGTRLLARAARLPRAQTYAIDVERGLRVPVADGTVLLADRYVARDAPAAPTILVRTPYRRHVFGTPARIFAERGYQVIVQNVRGTFGSGGTFNAFQDEQRDGLATLAWLGEQPWFTGSAAMFGLSYLGLTQWSVAADAPAWLGALAIQVSGSSFHPLIHPGGTFGLNGSLTWTSLLQIQELPPLRLAWRYLKLRRALPRAEWTLPLAKADRAAVGTCIPYFQDWLRHTQPDDALWAAVDFSQRLAEVRTPVNLVGGWHDIFIGRQLADYAALRAAGQRPQLTVGPWVHRSLGVHGAGLRESLAWFDTYLRGQTGRLRELPVRVFVMGARRWLDLRDWPPPSTAVEWFLQPHGMLTRSAGPPSAPSRYVYDPRRPTPSLGGPLLAAQQYVYDNRRLEARPDVLTFTSPPLAHELVVMGSPTVDLWVSSDRPSADFFARLCDVEPNGRSLNVTDAIVRVRPPSWPEHARITLTPTAYAFRQGHSLRLQISSGAFPRFDRNLGTTDPPAQAVHAFPAQQEVWHDPTHQSVLRLPSC